MGAKIAYISNVDYSTGMVRVAYPGSDKVSKYIPYISNGEYRMPKKGENVFVVSINGDDDNVACLGTAYDKVHVPEKTGKGIYHKKMTDTVSITATQDDLVITIGNKNVSITDLSNLLEGKKNEQ